jgi:hypothetical protein
MEESKKKIIIIGPGDPSEMDCLKEIYDNPHIEIICNPSGCNVEKYLSIAMPMHVQVLKDIEENMPFIFEDGLTKKERAAIIIPVRDSTKDPKISRNAPCPCGSGKKYKHCCIKKHQSHD